MKKVTLLVLFSFAFFLSKGQEEKPNFYKIRDTKQNHFEQLHQNSDQTGLVHGEKTFNRWCNFWESRVYDDQGTKGDLEMYSQKLEESVSGISNLRSSSIPFSWKSEGLNEVYKDGKRGQYGGRIEAVWISEENPNYMLAGSISSGLFKTINGGGDWINISKEILLPGMGIRDLLVDPNDENTILITTGAVYQDYGSGIFKTTDGGNSWKNVLEPEHNHAEGRKLMYEPNNFSIIYAAFDHEIHQSKDKGETWTQILTKEDMDLPPTWASEEAHITNMVFVPVPEQENKALAFTHLGIQAVGPFSYTVKTIDPSGNEVDSIIDVSQKDLCAKIIVCKNIDAEEREWKKVELLFPGEEDEDGAPGALGISIHEDLENEISVLSDMGNQVYLSKIYMQNPDTAQVICHDFGTEFGVWPGEFCFTMNQIPSNPNKYLVTANSFRPSYISILTLQDENITADIFTLDDFNEELHVDIRDAYLYTLDGKEYALLGTDGGIGSFCIDDPETKNLNGNGMSNNLLCGLGNSELEPNWIPVGLQDNGVFSNYSGNWNIIEWGDYADFLPHPTQKGKMFCSRFGMNSYETIQEGSQSQSDDPARQVHPYTEGLKDRPMKLAKTGNIWLGAQPNLWRSKIGNWAFPFEEITNFETFADTIWNDGEIIKINKVTDAVAGFDFSHDEKTMYVVLAGCTWGENKSKFFKSIDGGITWLNKSADLGYSNYHWAGLSDVIVNPFDENELWISKKGFTNNRILHSTDGGDSFEDLSVGMPKLPINALRGIVLNNTFELFAASDIGVHHYNSELSEWEYMSPMINPVWTTDIKFNYTAGEMRVSTFGHSLWIADFNKEKEPLIVSNDTTWYIDQLITRDVIVKEGATLTITSKVYFKDSKITVETGGKLNIEGGHLRNSGDNFWPGIDVEGNPNLPHTPSNQGCVSLFDATIENAKVGIKTFRNYNIQPAPLPEMTSGGIIKARSSHFKNCNLGVYFIAYKPVNTSYFSQCTFSFEGDFMPRSKTKMVYMNGVNGVSFTKCQFINKSAKDFWGRGIQSYNSSFKVFGRDKISPIGSSDVGYFKNLEYGIYANTHSMADEVQVIENQFHCSRGIYLASHTSASLLSNRFEIPNALTNPKGVYGIYLDACNRYHIENNNFACRESFRGEMGLYINNSGGDYNQVYRNNFRNLIYAINASGVNRNRLGVGLCFKCNNFNDCYNDISILKQKETGSDEKFFGIAAFQGSFLANDTAAAGNIFTDKEIAQYNIYNEGEAFMYFMHRKSSTPLNIEPGNVAPPNKVTVFENKGSFYDPLKSCPSKLGYINIIPIKNGLSQLKDQRDAARLELELKTDGGNSAALKARIETASVDESLEVKEELLSKSPYLSEEVLTSSTEREDLMPNALIRDVLVQNPQSAKSEEVQLKLDERATEMPGYMKADIQEGENKLGDLENETSSWMNSFNKREDAFRAIYWHYKYSDNANNEEVKALLAVEEALLPHLELVFIHLDQGDLESAMDYFENIPSNIEMNTEEQVLYNAFTEFMPILINLSNPNHNLNEQELDQIWMLYDNAPEMLQMMAIGILQEKGLLNYEEEILKPLAPNKSEAFAIENKETNASSYKNNTLTLLPNPAKNYVIIECLLEQAQVCELELFSAQGNKLYQKEISQSNQITIDLRDYASGTYIVQLRDGNRIIAKDKLQISK